MRVGFRVTSNLSKRQYMVRTRSVECVFDLMETRKRGNGVEERLEGVPLLLTAIQSSLLRLLFDPICYCDDEGVVRGGAVEMVPEQG